MIDGTDGAPRGARDAAAPVSIGKAIAYELYNVFGTPTGRRVMLAEGEAPPAAPNGWFWRPVAE